jgi:Tfp pilus assembly protein PilE
MGQQQLLLIVLGTIIVGIGIVVGLSVFRHYAIESKRNNVMNDCINLAAIAQQYYMRPESLGGGGMSFVNWNIPPELKINQNGTFIATTSADSIVIVGTGNEVVTGTDSVKVEVVVRSDKYKTKIIK